jgi:hypothetical protein|tara:strand:- start:285 stop:1127 length:843 start_codon:yes stop_codon:yes gene_type:complete
MNDLIKDPEAEQPIEYKDGESPVDKFYIWLVEDQERIEAEALLPKKAKRGRKPTKKQYFTYRTDLAIVAYNSETNYMKRNKVYREHIHYAFDKLAENIIHTFKFYYFDVPYIDVKCETVAFLNEKIHKYVLGKGKAFSYFSIVAKNYLIIANNANYAKMKAKADITVIDERRDLGSELGYSDYQEGLKDFTNQFVDYYSRNINEIFTNKRDIIVADTLLELFRIRDNIENFNKKALYILIRERTGLKTQNITKVVNIMKRHYSTMYLKYSDKGFIGTHKS